MGDREGGREREKERDSRKCVLFAGSTNREFSFRHDWNSLISDDETLLMKYYTKDYFPHADVYVSIALGLYQGPIHMHCIIMDLWGIH